MQYEDKDIELAFEIFSSLMQHGELSSKEELFRHYITRGEIRSIIETFAVKTDSTVIRTADYLYLVPLSGQSPFYIKNQVIKRDYLGSQAKNTDLYMMYFCIIVLFGEFYDSYETQEPTRDFLPLEQWMEKIRERVSTLKEHGEETLDQAVQETEWNWKAVIDYWESLDDLKENAKRQDTRQQTRLGFLKRVIRFLKDQKLIDEQGSGELVLTQKAKVIVQRYFMDREYNRGLLQFMYRFDRVEEGED
ncbi:MAG: DUF6063 family protein [Clostridiales bacterium]|nr:DUF6063 family protein [Clostridiales bacterium]MCF8023484.1 DUF6063 family protein [Clostridiales bacterium]